MNEIKEGLFYDKDYFETTKKRCAPQYNKETIYPIMMQIAQFLNNKYKPVKILDIGCAKGFLVKAFLDLGVEVWGVDISKYAVEESPRNIRERLKVANIEVEIPFLNNFFDLVTAIDIIEHLSSPTKALKEIHRILLPKGRVCIVTITPNFNKIACDISHVNVHNARYWKKMFRDSGFKTRLISPVNISIYKRGPIKSTIKKSLWWLKYNFHIIKDERNYVFILQKGKI